MMMMIMLIVTVLDIVIVIVVLAIAIVLLIVVVIVVRTGADGAPCRDARELRQTTGGPNALMVRTLMMVMVLI